MDQAQQRFGNIPGADQVSGMLGRGGQDDGSSDDQAGDGSDESS